MHIQVEVDLMFISEKECQTHAYRQGLLTLEDQMDHICDPLCLVPFSEV